MHFSWDLKMRGEYALHLPKDFQDYFELWEGVEQDRPPYSYQSQESKANKKKQCYIFLLSQLLNKFL